METNSSSISPGQFRHVLGQYPTGVVAVTAIDADGDPIGMILGSFGSVSLEPPLVAFMPAKSSSSWARLQEVDRWCINVLGADQEELCQTLASKRTDKFSLVSWAPTRHGSPRIEGCLAYIDCSREAVHDGGDHDVVLARVLDMAAGAAGPPLLFYRGGYGTFTAQSMLSNEAELISKVRLLDLFRDIPESLSQELGTEVSAVALVKDQVVLIASFGRSRAVDFPSRVGQYLPFVPPIGGVFAAWGGEALASSWLASVTDETDRARAVASLTQIRRRGFALGLGHTRSLEWERAAYRLSIGDPEVTWPSLCADIAAVLPDYNPDILDPTVEHEFHFAQAPILTAKGEVALALTLWGPPGTVRRDTIHLWGERLGAAAEAASRRIGPDGIGTGQESSAGSLHVRHPR